MSTSRRWRAFTGRVDRCSVRLVVAHSRFASASGAVGYHGPRNRPSIISDQTQESDVDHQRRMHPLESVILRFAAVGGERICAADTTGRSGVRQDPGVVQAQVGGPSAVRDAGKPLLSPRTGRRGAAAIPDGGTNGRLPCAPGSFWWLIRGYGDPGVSSRRQPATSAASSE